MANLDFFALRLELPLISLLELGKFYAQASLEILPQEILFEIFFTSLGFVVCYFMGVEALLFSCNDPKPFSFMQLGFRSSAEPLMVINHK